MGGCCGSCSVVSGRLSMRNLAVVHLILGAGKHMGWAPLPAGNDGSCGTLR